MKQMLKCCKIAYLSDRFALCFLSKSKNIVCKVLTLDIN